MMDGSGMTCIDGKSGDIPQAFSVWQKHLDFFDNMLDKDNCIMYSYSKNCNKYDYTIKEKKNDGENESV